MYIAPAIRKRVNKSGLTNIKIRITHRGDSRYIGTKFNILPEQWKDGIVFGHQSSNYINLELKQMVLDYEKKLLNRNIAAITIQRIIEMVVTREDPSDFIAHFNRFIDEKSNVNKRTAEIYEATLAKIRKFDKRDLMFEDINKGWLERFEVYLGRNGAKSANSRAIIFRNIRAVMNHAIDNEIITLNLFPFRRFKIKQEKTEHKGLTIDQVKAIRDYKTKWPAISLARDCFMLSFYLVGINTDDLYHEHRVKDDGKMEITGNGRLKYERAKTHRKYSVKIEPEAKLLMEKLKGKKSILCLSEHFDSVHAMTHSCNKALKKIMPELTMYHARHSWASIASNDCNATRETVGQALGHSTKETVTEDYIKRDPAKIDKLNRQVLDCLIKKEPA